MPEEPASEAVAMRSRKQPSITEFAQNAVISMISVSYFGLLDQI
jgi:hypothetical protein